MTNKLNVLVTGAAGDIAQSICKILRKDNRFDKIIGTDLHADHLGKLIFDSIETVPGCTEVNYLNAIKKVALEHDVELLIPCSEPELKYFHSNPLTEIVPWIFVMASNEALDVGFDKYATSKFLEEKGLPFPSTHLVEDISNPKYPFIAKARQGSGSKTVFLVKEDIDWNYIKSKNEDFIVQEYIPGDDREYTCGLFRSKSGEVRSIIVKRRMMSGSGLTGVGEVVKDEGIEALLSKVAKELNLVGSINVQLRKTDSTPLIFEINPRFSSTVLFRHLLGFKDLIWSIEDQTDQNISDYVPVDSGRKFYRGFQEYLEEK